MVPENWYRVHLEAKRLVIETNMCDENSTKTDSITAACFYAATNN